jgi:hypothetical protein
LPKKQTSEIGDMDEVHEALDERSKIILPPLRIKLGLMENFAGALDR